MLEQLEQDKEVALTRVHVKDLTVAHLTTLVVDLTCTDEEKAVPLAELLHSKTHGNPFFGIQMLDLLQQNSLLSYSITSFKQLPASSGNGILIAFDQRRVFWQMLSRL